MTINEIKKQAHEHAVKIGAYERCPRCGAKITDIWNCAYCFVVKPEKMRDANIIEKLREEVEEFADAVRENRTADNNTVQLVYRDSYHLASSTGIFEREIKNTIGDELSDIIITALAGAEELGIDIDAHIQAKLSYNKIREDHKK